MVAAEVVGTKKNVSTTSDNMGQHQKICCSKTYENSL